MAPHQQRVVDEKAALDTLRTKLCDFIEANPIFPTLPGEEQIRLQRQRDAMALYSYILGERIAAF